MSDFFPLIDLMNLSNQLVHSLNKGHSSNKKLSPQTATEYQKIGARIMALHSSGAQFKTIISESKTRSHYHKKLVASEFFARLDLLRILEKLHDTLKNERNDVHEEHDLQALESDLRKLCCSLEELTSTRSQGYVGPSRKRRSKRLTLSRLPDDWREQLYAHGKSGKYADAILVCALCGCRPAELQKGVSVSLEYDSNLQKPVLRIAIDGVKVSNTQGQSIRQINYSADSDHPLVRAMVHRVLANDTKSMLIRINSSINFTVEVRRLGRKLWPRISSDVTAYCFRHQFSADLKAAESPERVSIGLGHRSAKTRKFYGRRIHAAKSPLTPISLYGSSVRSEKQSFSFRTDRSLTKNLDGNV